jgi:hypothetical protein
MYDICHYLSGTGGTYIEMGVGRGTHGPQRLALRVNEPKNVSRVNSPTTFGSSVVLTYGLGRMILYFGGTGVGPVDFGSAVC